jgi:metal-responsive CopG/Arc/MetJ family transcriptional regulator
VIRKLTEKTPIKFRWVVEVTDSLNKALNQAILTNSHNTKSEFIRDIVRKQLEKMGYDV